MREKYKNLLVIIFYIYFPPLRHSSELRACVLNARKHKKTALADSKKNYFASMGFTPSNGYPMSTAINYYLLALTPKFLFFSPTFQNSPNQLYSSKNF